MKKLGGYEGFTQKAEIRLDDTAFPLKWMVRRAARQNAG
jgi:hypothetical protein